MMTILRPSTRSKSSFEASASELGSGEPGASPGAPAGGAADGLPGAHVEEAVAPVEPVQRYEAPYAVGDQFLKFELRAQLGRGGQALVLEGYDSFLERTVAIKFLAPRDEKMRQMLARRARAEARVLSRLEHENVVRVFDAGPTEDGGVYIVMERLYGQTLRAAMRQRGSLGIAEVLTIGIQISRGVAAAHEMGVIHRDLKPENVFIESGNRVKVVDFGIAKVLGDDINTTQRDRVHGTVLYMSPEHLKGLGVTPKSDVYALGIMLYEALHRHPALVDGRPREWLQVALFQVEELPTPLEQVEPGFPHYVSRILQRATAKEPGVRFPTMLDFCEALEGALQRYKADCLQRGVGVVIEDLSLVRERDDISTSAATRAVSSARVLAASGAQVHYEPTVPVDALTTRTAGIPGVAGPGGRAASRPTSWGLRWRRGVAGKALGVMGGLLLVGLGAFGAFELGRASGARAGTLPGSSAEGMPASASRTSLAAAPAVSGVSSAPSKDRVRADAATAVSATAAGAVAAPSASAPASAVVTTPASPSASAVVAPTVSPRASALPVAAASPTASSRPRPVREARRAPPAPKNDTLAQVDDYLALLPRTNSEPGASAGAKRSSATGGSASVSQAGP